MNRIFSSSNILFRVVLFALISLFIIGGFSDWIVEWLWLDNLGYEEVFWTIKTTQALLLIGALVVALAYVLPNMSAIGKRFGTMNFGNSPLAQLNLNKISTKKIRNIFLGLGSIFSLFFSLAFFMRWDTYFRFHWDEVVGQVDPIFGHDIGFYLFRLPFIELIQNSMVSLVFFVTLITLILYIYSGAISLQSSKRINAASGVKKQISLNLGLWFLLLSWGYYLDRYNLLYSDGGAAYGASYVDLNVKLPVLWIVCLLCFGLALLSFFQLYKTKLKWLALSGAATLVIGGIGLNILPGAIQKFSVDPSELQLETPHIKNSISQTREAYGLDEMETQPYSVKPPQRMSWSMVQQNEETIENIRLWDPRLLIQTYRQLQEIRLYYQFYNVDVDRYHTNEGYLQMMVAARELSEELPEQSDTWVNRRLQYTHGYGMVMSPVAQEGSQGDPRMVIKDIPPVSDINLKVDQPAIYYGEHNSDYKIVNTNVRELDYPSGDKNIYTNYQGSSGVSINNLFEQLLFSWQFGDINILLTDYINENSKILFWKQVQERVKRIAPFLRLEDDPYLVLNDGKLYWIQDAYTTSADYPYSAPYNNQYNYIRNSVKVVVDAYNGSVDFYTSDEQDPILKVYRDIFPDMFKPLNAMSDGLRSHLRYPIHIFKAQMDRYNKYHMTDPQVFYNNEDLWTRPNEKYEGRSIKMEPYYVLTKLPGQQELQYLLISPLTPNNRDNMIGWMAANSDFPNYGDISVFELPKDRLILGPAQIEARIDQDTEISRQLALWDQRGSRVIRGNLMIIPIQDSFIYVEPVFLIAEGVDIPQLQRVIATSGDKIAMQPTLWESIEALYGQQRQPIAAPTDTSTVPLPQVNIPAGSTNQTLSQLQTLWQEAREALSEGDWTLYGEKMNEIEELLSDN
ncbi:UPF0182 family membrane protein [Fodinibius salsisoli]|uniref:UPF0182 protein J6I44_06270 n=1 Tax=Fodinibius salsisoli TaxID=2820877 RepID=A0ABT3PKS6_9BACT|nr:UPF0182 family protein [Fodinibius salsisoli]MCW9706450.1 UPF0182 family protein [Fodinibius salsisoli]